MVDSKKKKLESIVIERKWNKILIVPKIVNISVKASENEIDNNECFSIFIVLKLKVENFVWILAETAIQISIKEIK